MLHLGRLVQPPRLLLALLLESGGHPDKTSLRLEQVDSSKELEHLHTGCYLDTIHLYGGRVSDCSFSWRCSRSCSYSHSSLHICSHTSSRICSRMCTFTRTRNCLSARARSCSHSRSCSRSILVPQVSEGELHGAEDGGELWHSLGMVSLYCCTAVLDTCSVLLHYTALLN